MHDIAWHGTIYLVAAKSATGRENPLKLQATQTPIASFFVSVPSVAIPSGQHGPLFMVALVGQSSDWPVSCNAGILTPANVTAICKRENLGGDSLTQLQEAAVMVATPTQLYPIFIGVVYHACATPVVLFPFLRSLAVPADVVPSVRVIAKCMRSPRLGAGFTVISFTGV